MGVRGRREPRSASRAAPLPTTVGATGASASQRRHRTQPSPSLDREHGNPLHHLVALYPLADAGGPFAIVVVAVCVRKARSVLPGQPVTVLSANTVKGPSSLGLTSSTSTSPTTPRSMAKRPESRASPMARVSSLADCIASHMTALVTPAWLAASATVRPETSHLNRPRSKDTARKVVEVVQLMWRWADESDRWTGRVPGPRRIDMPRNAPKPPTAPTWVKMDACIAAVKTEWARDPGERAPRGTALPLAEGHRLTDPVVAGQGRDRTRQPRPREVALAWQGAGVAGSAASCLPKGLQERAARRRSATRRR